MEEIQPSELPIVLRGRPGLIIGSAATLNNSDFETFVRKLTSHFSIEVNAPFRSICNSVLVDPSSEEPLRQFIKTNYSEIGKSPSIETFGKANWSAVLSLCVDRYFETALQSAAHASPARDDISTVVALDKVIPPHTVPVYKLLSTIDQPDMPLSFAQYKKRKSKWRTAIANFADRVRGRAVVCLGLDELESDFEDLLAETLAHPSSRLSRLLFIGNNEVANIRNIQEILGTGTQLLKARISPSVLVQSILKTEKNPNSITQMALDFSSNKERLSEAIVLSRDLAVHVPTKLAQSCQDSDRNLIIDRLFSPDSLHWDAFKHGFDFARDIEQETLASISAKDDGSVATVILGNAGSGKTTFLKRVATAISSQNAVVFWMTPYFGDRLQNDLDRFFQKLALLDESQGGKVFILLDDPYSFGAQNPQEIARAALKHKVNIQLVVAIRNTDWEINGAVSAVGGLKINGRFHLNDALSETEWTRLPEFLLKLGVSTSLDEAKQELASAESRSARDIFATLFFLLPDVRATLKNAIEEQYFRLGDQSGLKRFVMGGLEQALGVLRDAWAMTAVADRYKSPLPIEVLVNALGIDYTSWLDASRSVGNAFGLLYEQTSDDGQTIWFKTRNSIVTDILVRAVNGCKFGYSGELSFVKKMIEGSRGHSSSVYRDFIANILIPNENVKHLSPDDGLDLYDLAVDVLHAGDKAIEHHRGLWLKNFLDDPIAAEASLRKALDTANYPYASRLESNRNIHTTIAANELRKIDKGLVSFETGRENVTNELAKARSIQDCDPRIAHVQGKLVARLVRFKNGEVDQDTMFLMNRALADIDRAILTVCTGRHAARRSVTDETSLEQAREELQSLVTDIDVVKKNAQLLWEQFKSQTGFVLASRLLHRKAVNSNRGKDFNAADNYCLSCISTIEAAHCNVDKTLFEVALHNLCRWQFPMLGVSISPPDWIRVKHLCVEVLADCDLSADPFTRFVYAVALAQEGAWADANANFRRLRANSIPFETLHAPRTVLVDDSGAPRKVEGTVRVSGDTKFLSIGELGTDVECSRRDRWRGDGLDDFAFIEFAFSGPRAISDRSLTVRWGV